MTTNDADPDNMRLMGSARASQRSCFQRRQIVTIAVKVERPFTISEEKNLNAVLKGTYVVEIAFNTCPPASERKSLESDLVFPSRLYRNCFDMRFAFSFIRRVIAADGGVCFCCSDCCVDHELTPLASLFFCDEHYASPFLE